ncbi:MAG: HPr family phosphocarrier protein [Planctomycetota bacterium]|nr:HPr family phosphocarrier protein [Planctomycetota bacterium]
MGNGASITVKIVNRLGLHARPAMTFVDVASTFQCAIRVCKGDTDVDGKSIMQMMMLAASQGSELRITAEGADADAALVALKRLVESGFDEE